MTTQHENYKLSCEDALAFVCDAAWGFAELDEMGRFKWVNRAYCEILNAPRELIEGTPFAMWTHPDDREIDRLLAQKVADGEIPSYDLAKYHLLRGSTPQQPRKIWGMYSASGKWRETGEFAGYLVQFRVMSSENSEQRPLIDWMEVVRWLRSNKKSVLTVLALIASLIAGSSAPLLELLKDAKQAADSVESVLESSSSSASPPPATP